MATMRIGVPKEIKVHEYRVGLVPAAGRELVEAGHEVLVQTGAAAGIGFADADYQRVGAKIAASAVRVRYAAPADPKGLRRTIRRTELRQIVPLADSTIYELERRGEFPQRFYLTARCVVWDLAEVMAWLQSRRQAGSKGVKKAPMPDYAFKGQEEAGLKALSTSYILSGLLGAALVMILILLLGRIIARDEKPRSS